MEHFTRAELSWLIEAGKMAANYYGERADRAVVQMERGLANLRSEQLTAIFEKLQRVYDGGSKRIAIQ